jgi:hypothetical protein
MMQGFRALLASELFMRDPTNRQLSQGRGIVDWETQNWGSNPRCETRGDQLSRNHVFQTFADGPSVRRLKDAQRLVHLHFRTTQSGNLHREGLPSTNGGPQNPANHTDRAVWVVVAV